MAAKRAGRLRPSTVCIIVLAGLTMVMAAALLFIPRPDPVAVIPFTYSQGAVVNFEDELILVFQPGEPRREDRLLIRRLQNLPEPECNGEPLKTFSVEFGSGWPMELPVRVEMCFVREVEEGILDTPRGVRIMHIDHFHQWTDVPSFHGENHSLVFHADSFSGYGMVTRDHRSHPGMTLNAPAKPPLRLEAGPDPGTAEAILAGLHISGEPDRSAIQTGMDAFIEAFDLASIASGFSDLPFLDAFNAVSGEIGVLLSLASVSMEIFHGDDDTARAELAAGLLDYSVGRWGWQNLRIANIGVFLINHSLTRFGEAALEGRHALWQSRYGIYNLSENPHRMNREGWDDFLVQALLNSTDIEAALNRRLDLYLSSYFNHHPRGILCPDIVRAALEDQERARMYSILRLAVSRVKEGVRSNQEREILQRFSQAREMLNRRRQVLITVHGDSLGDPRVRGLPVMIPVDRDQELWQGITDEAGQWSLPLTWYGYLHYGSPSTVQLEYDGETLTAPLRIETWGGFGTVRFYLEREERTIPISSDPPGALIHLDGSPTGLTTPAELPAPDSGAHHVSLELPGYMEFSAEFTITDDAPPAIHAVLEEEPEPQTPDEGIVRGVWDNMEWMGTTREISRDEAEAWVEGLGHRWRMPTRQECHDLFAAGFRADLDRIGSHQLIHGTADFRAWSSTFHEDGRPIYFGFYGGDTGPILPHLKARGFAIR